MNRQIHVTAVTWLFVNSLIMICSNNYNLFSTNSRHKDGVLKDDDIKTNDWLLEMNDKYLQDLRSNSSEELQKIELKSLYLLELRYGEQLYGGCASEARHEIFTRSK